MFNPTQSIIVYRNPIEQAFWESGMITPIIFGVVAIVILVCALHALLDHSFKLAKKSTHRSKLYTYLSNAIIVLSTIGGFYVSFHYLT